MRERISPCCPRLTASGLMIAKVRSSDTKIPPEYQIKDAGLKPGATRQEKVSGLKSRATVSLFQSGGQSGTQVRWSFHRANSCSGHRRVFVFGGSLPTTDD